MKAHKILLKMKTPRKIALKKKSMTVQDAVAVPAPSAITLMSSLKEESGAKIAEKGSQEQNAKKTQEAQTPEEQKTIEEEKAIRLLKIEEAYNLLKVKDMVEPELYEEYLRAYPDDCIQKAQSKIDDECMDPTQLTDFICATAKNRAIKMANKNWQDGATYRSPVIGQNHAALFARKFRKRFEFPEKECPLEKWANKIRAKAQTPNIYGQFYAEPIYICGKAIQIRYRPKVFFKDQFRISTNEDDYKGTNDVVKKNGWETKDWDKYKLWVWVLTYKHDQNRERIMMGILLKMLDKNSELPAYQLPTMDRPLDNLESRALFSLAACVTISEDYEGSRFIGAIKIFRGLLRDELNQPAISFTSLVEKFQLAKQGGAKLQCNYALHHGESDGNLSDNSDDETEVSDISSYYTP